MAPEALGGGRVRTVACDYPEPMPRTLHDLSWPRHTERLTVGRLAPEDADALWALKNDPELNRWTTRIYASREEFHADWDSLAATHLMAHWGGRLAAYLMVKQQDAWSQTDVTEQARGQQVELGLSLIHISEPTRRTERSRMPSSA